MPRQKYRYQLKAFKSGASKAFATEPLHSRKEVEKKTTKLKKRGAVRFETRVLTKQETLGGIKK